jgi:hypothetical protein
VGDERFGTTPTLAMPAAVVAPAPQPAETVVLPRVEVAAPSPSEPGPTPVMPRSDDAVPASIDLVGPTLVLPRVEVEPPPLPPVRTEVPARSGIAIGPGLGVGPTMALPKVDLRPSNPGMPLSSLAGLRPRLADAEAAPGDVLPEGAATLQMEAWSPPADADTAPGPPPSSAAPPTQVMPVAAVPAAPSTEAALTVMMGAVDIEPGRR